jgi:hypothetical protein
MLLIMTTQERQHRQRLQNFLSEQSAFEFRSIKSLSRTTATMAVNVFKKKVLMFREQTKINDWYSSEKGQETLAANSFAYNTKDDFLRISGLSNCRNNWNKEVKAGRHSDEQLNDFIAFWKKCKEDNKKCSLSALDFNQFVNGKHASQRDETETNDSDTETNEDTKQTVLTLSCTQFDVNVSLRIEKDSNGDLKLITTNDGDQIDNVLQFIKSNLF